MQTVRIRRSVHSLANCLAKCVRYSDISASSRDVEIKSRLVPVSPLIILIKITKKILD